MSTKQGAQSDVSSAPESGTVRGSTSGNNPAKGGQPVRQPEAARPAKEENPAWRPGEPPDDESSAPESGTVRNETSGNNPAKGGDLVREGEPSDIAMKRPGEPSDDVSSAPESGTVR